MKHSSSLQAINLACQAVQKKSKKIFHHNALCATNWIQDQFAAGMVYCQYAGCDKHFPLMDGFTSPLPILRMIDNEISIAEYPLLIFCSPEHLLAASIPFGSIITSEDGYEYPIH